MSETIEETDVISVSQMSQEKPVAGEPPKKNKGGRPPTPKVTATPAEIESVETVDIVLSSGTVALPINLTEKDVDKLNEASRFIFKTSLETKTKLLQKFQSKRA